MKEGSDMARSTRSEGESEVLRLPNFRSDASKMLRLLEAKADQGKAHPREPIIHELIGARIDSLAGLFRPRHSQQHRGRDDGHIPAIKVRSTDLSEEQLSVFVLRGACSETFLRPKTNRQNIIGDSKASKAFMDSSESDNTLKAASSNSDGDGDDISGQISEQYRNRREELRNMAKSLHESRRRRMLAMEPPPDFLMRLPIENDDDMMNVRNTVRVDRHGRLVRIPEDQTNREENGGANTGNDQADELVDASDTFWSMDEARRKNESVGTGTGRGDAMLHIPAAPPPVPMVNQPMRLREMSQQMERDATAAIQRALDRYRREDEEFNRQRNNPAGENDANQQVFELVRIPLAIDGDEQRGFSLFGPNRDRNQVGDADGDDAGGRNDGNRQGQRNRQGMANGGNQIRIALRRICYAVIAVAAAFICTIIQGVAIDLRYSGRLDINSLWLTGMMGPHFQGHHHQQSKATMDIVREVPVPEDDGEADEDPSPFAMFWSRKILAADFGSTLNFQQWTKFGSEEHEDTPGASLPHSRNKASLFNSERKDTLVVQNEIRLSAKEYKDTLENRVCDGEMGSCE